MKRLYLALGMTIALMIVVQPPIAPEKRVIEPWGNSGQDFSQPAATTAYPWPMYTFNETHAGLTTSPSPDDASAWWFNSTGATMYGSPAIAEGKVFIGMGDPSGDSMLAFYINNGTRAWRMRTTLQVPNGNGVSSTPAYSNGLLFFAADRIYALYASNGTVKWSVPLPYQNWGGGTPTVAQGKVFVGGSDWKLYAIDQTTGTVLWTSQAFNTQPTGGSNYGLYSAPAVWNNSVYLAACDGYVYQFDVTQPGPVASYSHRSLRYRTMYGSPVVFGGRVYVGDGYYTDPGGLSRFRALWASDLTEAWVFTSPTPGSFFSSAAVAYNKIFVGSTNGNVYALNPTNGGLVWNYQTGASVWSSPAISDGKLFIGSQSNNLYSFNTNQTNPATSRWSQPMGGDVDSSPAISDGRVCVGTFGNGGRVYCFGTPIAPPVDSPPSVQAWEPGGAPGQVYTQGQIVQVRWKATDDNPMPLNNVNVSYGSATFTDIIRNTANDGIQPWDTTGVPPGTYSIRITAFDSKGQESVDLGNNTFQIRLPNTPPAITITQPTGGESWTGGSVHSIDWTASDAQDPVGSLRVWVNYSVTGGPPFNRQIAGLQGVQGSARPYAWTVAFEDSASVVLNSTVVDTAGAKGYYVSLPFEIDSMSPFVTSTSPFGGETGVPTSANVLVGWSEPMNRASAESAFSLADTATWTPVAGAFSWAGNQMTFDPAGLLATGTWYSANLTQLAADDSQPGNYMVAVYQWTFLTATSADLTPPTILAAIAIPDPQEIPLSVNVSALVQDNVAVGGVLLNITNPIGGTTNSTMWLDSGSGRYFLIRVCGITGVHTFVIWAVDTSGNWNSTSGQFTCVDTTPPTITDPRAVPDPVQIFTSTNVSAIVSDNYQLSQVWIEVAAPDLTSTNQTMTPGLRYFREITATQLGTYAFRISAVDSVGLWAVAQGQFNATDKTPPAISGLSASPNPVSVFAQTNLSATVIDNYLLAGVWVRITAPDATWTNQSMLAGVRFYFNTAANQVGIYAFEVSAVDSSGNWNSAASTFASVDLLPPVIQHTPIASRLAGTPLNITANVTDNYLLQEVRLNYTDVDGVAHGVIMTRAMQDEHFSVVPAQSHAGSLTYNISAEDSSGNTAQTQSYTVSITELRPNPPLDFTVAPEGYGALRLNWTVPTNNTEGSPLTDLAGFNVYRMNVSGGSWFKVNSALVQGATYLDTGLLDGTTYHYYVVAVNSHDIESDRSNEAFGTTLARPTTGPGVQTDNTLILVAVFIILAVAIAIIALLLMKRRKKRGELEGQKETESESDKGTKRAS